MVALLVTPAQKHLRQIHRQLYEKTFAEAISLPTLSDPAISRYAKNFSTDLPSDFHRVSLQQALDAILANRIILYGDFHTLRQSQRGLFRLLRALIKRSRSMPFTLALELLSTEDQPAVDAFLEHRISEKEFLTRIRYQSSWGFPWPHYKVFFDFCREHQIPIIGINLKGCGVNNLVRRDRVAAKAISNYIEMHPDRRVICMIGEYHLAVKHLPHQLLRHSKTKKAPSILRIFNNIDKYFFKLEQDLAGLTTEYLRLSDNSLCVLNTPPWVKWFSVIMWEEMQDYESVQAEEALTTESDLALGADDDDPSAYTEYRFDFEFLILSFMKQISTFLGMAPDESILDHFTVKAPPSEEDYIELKRTLGLDDQGLLTILHRTNVDGLYVAPSAKLILVNKISLNNLAEAAGQFLLGIHQETLHQSDDPIEAFYQRTLQYAAGMFATKVLNPRLKAYDIGYYRSYLSRQFRKQLKGFAAHKRSNISAVLKHDDWVKSRLTEPPRHHRWPHSVYRQDVTSNFEVSRMLGQLLGYRLYMRMIRNRVQNSVVKSLFQHQLSGRANMFSHFLALYADTSPMP